MPCRPIALVALKSLAILLTAPNPYVRVFTSLTLTSFSPPSEISSAILAVAPNAGAIVAALVAYAADFPTLFNQSALELN